MSACACCPRIGFISLEETIFDFLNTKKTLQSLQSISSVPSASAWLSEPKKTPIKISLPEPPPKVGRPGKTRKKGPLERNAIKKLETDFFSCDDQVHKIP